MKKTLGIIIITLIILAIISYLRDEIKTKVLNQNPATMNDDNHNSVSLKKSKSVDPSGYKNTSYILNGQRIFLKDGISENEPNHDESEKSITKFFGNEVVADFNGDRINDVAFLLSQQTGGTGVFFYLVVALNTPNGYIGSNGFFIGDRIAPQNTMLGDRGSIIVNYADRYPDEPYTADPTFGRSIKLIFDSNTLSLSEALKN